MQTFFGSDVHHTSEADRILDLLVNSSLANDRTSGQLEMIEDERGEQIVKKVQAAIERVLDGESAYAVAQSTEISRWTLTRILDDDDRLALYVDIETNDDRVADALDATDIDPVDLPESFEERIRSVSVSICLRNTRARQGTSRATLREVFRYPILKRQSMSEKTGIYDIDRHFDPNPPLRTPEFGTHHPPIAARMSALSASTTALSQLPHAFESSPPVG